ncbi:MAG: menaquinone biosynthesis protein [Candidatus Hinthialibacter antarcticus]|nr:menaquinone biosynthesis protein [Candidatus Hinthialibacter antarcticus]
MNDLSSLRIGAVPFSNGLPLSFYLSEFLPGPPVIQAVPSQLGPMLARGELDVAMLSSIELKRHPEYQFIPGMGVCSDGPVHSVMLWARRPAQELTRVALDGNSLSSTMLLRILFREVWKNTPEYVTYTPPLANGLDIAEAALTIGDSSFIDAPDGVQVIDLGQVWKEHTGLPFVYAPWITREGIDPKAIAKPFQLALEKGLQNRRALAEHCAQNGGTQSADFYYRYLTESIYYPIGERELAGLQQYLARADR